MLNITKHDIILLIVYIGTVCFVSNVCYEAYNRYRLDPMRLEDSDLDCTEVYNATASKRKTKHWRANTDFIKQQLEWKVDIFCELINKFFYFQKTPMSSEEAHFPLAFGLLIHTDMLQALLTLSLIYQPQNQYCITLDDRADYFAQGVFMKLPRCFANVHVHTGGTSEPHLFKMGVLNNVWQCVYDLTDRRLGLHWKYYQFVANHDIPLKTNLEMVRILKALNGSMNTEIYPMSSWRYGIRRLDAMPVPLYQGEMAVALPRETADFIMHNQRITSLFTFLNKTHMPYESLWATILGGKRDLKAPGTFNGQELIELQKEANGTKGPQSVEQPGKTAIARLEISSTRNGCSANPNCAYDLNDIAMLLSRPELFAHKMYLLPQPAAYVCLAKELRRRSVRDTKFNTTGYGRMPTVELHNGLSANKLTNREWAVTSGKHEKF